MNNNLPSVKKPNYPLLIISLILGVLLIWIVYYTMSKTTKSPSINLNTIEKKEKKDPTIGMKRTDVPQNNVPLGFVKKDTPVEPQVYNISENIYTYNDAEAVCKAFGSELATYEQLVAAYKKGADWCNYGWSKGGMALYPTQFNKWQRLQENNPDRRDTCGTPGINGGYFDNKNLMFGVNCYGIKPSPRPHEKTKRKHLSDRELEIARKVSDIRSKMNDITILPFNEDKWSPCNNN